MADPFLNDQPSGFITISKEPDIRIFYTLSSPLSTNKPVIVLSSSLAAATPLWNEFVTNFAHTHTILRYDARFHGRSPLSTTHNYDYEKGHSMEDLAEDVVKLLDALHITKPVTFIGLSIGAGVGVILGAKYAAKFEKLIIVGTKAGVAPSDGEAFDGRIAFIREEGGRAQGRQSVLRWFGEGWIAANPEKATFVEDIVSNQSLEGFIASVAALRKLDLWSYVDEVARRGDGGKFLFVVGEWDVAVVGDTRSLAERAGSSLVVVEEAGHIVHLQQPERFYGVVRSSIGV